MEILAHHGGFMSHKISNVVIKNYKLSINTELKLSRFTPLVGLFWSTPTGHFPKVS
jgi:hypothetical protein